uniref:Ras-GEF domain-containing family member 1B n=1 Tax=Phallusia mammillata TaxID=59560 RepID=A0A6F9DR28_9ASCI|nr:ras-GEF domain-containing family member 1B [Phallusia mammillata]
MDETIHQEGLLRHLLSERHLKEDDEFVYSFLLGSRLFLSPHQLLTELNRLASEDQTTVTQSNLKCAGSVCSKCRQMHGKPPSPVGVERSQHGKASVGFTTDAKDSGVKGTDFRSPSPAQVSENITEGEDTIRRRIRGRRRAQTDSDVTSSASALPNRLVADRSSVVSRDSGILSAVIEIDEIDSANSGHSRRRVPPSPRVPEVTSQEPSTSLSCNDSGMILDEEDDELCNCQDSMVTSPSERHANRRRQLVHVLHEWVRHFPADFRNKKVMWTLNDVIKSCQTDNQELQSRCTAVVDCISRRMAAQESYEQHLTDADMEDALQKTQNARKTRDKLVSTIMNLKDAADVNQMAQQLSLIELDFLKHVGSEEFLQLFTANGDEDVRTNLGACVRWFNRLSHLVGTVTCMCRKRKRARHVITFFARVANRCFELSNFNSSMAILTGLSLGPVTRLKRTWNKLKLSELHKLQNAFDPANNFQKYRTIYASRIGSSRAAMASPSADKTHDDVTNRYSMISQHSMASVTSTCSQHGDSGIECDHDTSPSSVTSPGVSSPGTTSSKTKESTSTPKKHFKFERTVTPEGRIVPFLVLLVKDVYFLNHTIHTVQKDGSINFEKLRQLSNLLRPLEEWKHITAPYPKDRAMQEFLLHTPVHNDEELYLLSYKREAPTNRFEKQQLKTLRADRDSKKKNRNESSLSKSARRKTM